MRSIHLDLDQFKIVNDTCGHLAGDELLKQLTSLLQAKLRKDDTLARLGGDEFGLLLERCPRGPAFRVAEVLRQTVEEFRFVWEERVFSLGISIGLATFFGGEQTFSDVLRMADTACFLAKDKGRNRVQLYASDDKNLEKRRGKMGWVERHGLMPQIDRWVTANVFAQYASHRSQGTKDTCTINLSGASICDEHLYDFVVDQFKQSQVDPAGICFEITETAAIANLIQAAALIRKLKELGCRFSLDDFGSGMSSFTYLKHLLVNRWSIHQGHAQ